MTVHLKNNPVGIDLRISKFQNVLNNGLSWGDIDIYGRLYSNKRDGKDVSEAYIGGNEYKEVFVDDYGNKSAVFAFLIGENRSGFTPIEADVTLVCSCNLNRIYGNDERRDEETLLEVLSVLDPYIIRDREGNIKTGLENVFSFTDSSRFKFRDMSPWFNFAITFKTIYKNLT